VKMILIVIALCLIAGMAHAGTFELADPAAEIMEEQNNPKNDQQPQDGDHGTSSEAGDLWGKWTGKGIGNTACNEHVSYKQESSEQYRLNLFWLQGFIDGVGYQRFITLGDYRLSPVYESDSMEIWIENYCSENPLESLFQAVESFIKELN
jgi:hypothetical protein